LNAENDVSRLRNDPRLMGMKWGSRPRPASSIVS
jgi:hypothetical protein